MRPKFKHQQQAQFAKAHGMKRGTLHAWLKKPEVQFVSLNGELYIHNTKFDLGLKVGLSEVDWSANFCKLHGISQQTMKARIQRGKFELVKINGRLCYTITRNSLKVVDTSTLEYVPTIEELENAEI